jgi:thioredoxin reductase (NADPH)
MYDVIIIGKGPAGISASLYTVRSKLTTLIIGKADSVLNKASQIDNYFGFSKSISGKELLNEGEKQALRLGVDILNEEVISIEKNDYFEVTTTNNTFSAKTVLLASGQPQKKVAIENLHEFEGKGISYCSTCDGFFYNNLKVAVLGAKDFAAHEASELETFTKNITIFTNGHELELSEKYKDITNKYKINKKPIKKVDGAEFLQRVLFMDGSSEEVDGIFIANESASSIDFARKMGIIAEGNSIVVNKLQQTNLEGLFAAGDCTGGFKQVSVAVGQGAIAAKNMIEYIKNL